MHALLGLEVQSKVSGLGRKNSPSRPAGGSLITLWLEVRVLPAPPRTPIRTECSGDSSISPPIGGSLCGRLVSRTRQLGFGRPFRPCCLWGPQTRSWRGHRDCHKPGQINRSDRASLCWRDHSTGASRRRVTPMPRGSRPSIAAFTRSGARKASDIVMLTWRTLHLSRLAMLSTFAFASSTSSLSQRRPRAIDAIKVARVSDRIGRAWCGGSEAGRSISRRRVNRCFAPRDIKGVRALRSAPP